MGANVKDIGGGTCTRNLAIALIAASFMAPVAARAQAPIGAVGETDVGLDEEMAADKLAYFHDHIKTLRRESQSFPNVVQRGQVIPPQFALYDIPPEFGRPDARYTVLNDHVVVVNPTSRRIIQVID
jgi:hypothetical protein